ncbi:hypothetical protein BDW69DRAFT_78878 [Aspergillus filifer]
MASISSFQTPREQCRSALKRFLDSPKDFEVITSVARAGLDPSPPSKAHTQGLLYVLDSSFNPPTKAHEHIAGSAIVENRSKPVWGKPSRVLLLLATQNADKPSKPASFEDRLIMMQLCARDLQRSISSLVDEINCPVIDIGVTKKPYFVDKATAIESAGVYPSELQQVHLTGYDTLIRIFNTKYYPPEHTLAPLEPFLSKHKLRVTVRPDDEWGSEDEQAAYVEDLAQGGRESEGGKREWAKQIEIVEGSITEKRPVSSTKAREAIQRNTQDLDWLVQPSVREFVLSQQPYPE